MPGTLLGNVWTDIPPINSQAQERLGYPTQKPEALLERIMLASSNEGDTVLDPFCGCGTAIAVAQRLDRRWIGIDITHLAIALIKQRLRDTFGDAAVYKVIGEPVTLPDARGLAEQDPYQFQWWALGLVGARPVEQKKGSDKGIDGWLYFHDEAEGGKTKQVMLSVKAGHTSVAHVRDLRGVMRAGEGRDRRSDHHAGADAADARRGGRRRLLPLARLEQELSRDPDPDHRRAVGGKGIDMPPIGQMSTTFRKAPKAKDNGTHTQPPLMDP